MMKEFIKPEMIKGWVELIREKYPLITNLSDNEITGSFMKQYRNRHIGFRGSKNLIDFITWEIIQDIVKIDQKREEIIDPPVTMRDKHFIKYIIKQILEELKPDGKEVEQKQEKSINEIVSEICTEKRKE